MFSDIIQQKQNELLSKVNRSEGLIHLILFRSGVERFQHNAQLLLNEQFAQNKKPPNFGGFLYWINLGEVRIVKLRLIQIRR